MLRPVERRRARLSHLRALLEDGAVDHGNAKLHGLLEGHQFDDAGHAMRLARRSTSEV